MRISTPGCLCIDTQRARQRLDARNQTIERQTNLCQPLQRNAEVGGAFFTARQFLSQHSYVSCRLHQLAFPVNDKVYIEFYCICHIIYKTLQR